MTRSTRRFPSIGTAAATAAGVLSLLPLTHAQQPVPAPAAPNPAAGSATVPPAAPATPAAPVVGTPAAPQPPATVTPQSPAAAATPAAAAPPPANPPPAATPPAPEPPPAPAPPPPPDPKYIKQLESILNQKFNRDPYDIFHALSRTGTTDPATMTPQEKLLLAFRTGDWGGIRSQLAQMPPEFSRRIYDKMLSDLTEKPKPNMRLDDVIGLSDAVPGDLTNDEVRRLGQLTGLAVPANESYWLADKLKKGTEKFGGNDPAKRLLAGRILLAGGFKDLAREYLPPLDQVQQITDEGVRNDVTAFLNTQQESEAAQRGQMQKIWDENLRTLTLAKVNDWERTKAASALAKIITQIPQTTLAPIMTDLVKSNPDSAVRLISNLGVKVQNESRGEIQTRVDNIKVQAAMAGLLAANVDLKTQPWSQLAQMMAEFWMSEADNTFTIKTADPNSVRGQKFVAPEELLPMAPTGKWAESLPEGLRQKLDVTMSKLILVGANFDQAAERIVEIGKRSAGAGVALAEDFLNVWAKAHNPTLPEALRRQYELPEDARIPVTPIMMEKNIESLARMMELFRKAGIAPNDYAKVVGAFDLAYSNAEAYRAGHVAKVFGPIEKMDEPLFFLIVSRMSSNLSERWRKMDVQKAGLTRRDEAQTLEMVRTGYTSALAMIDGWMAGHPESSSRALTLAGTLLTDWGDFEYFQELVTGDARKRMLGYKEKNLQAQDYFQRGAEAYAKEVPKLNPADYSIAAYLSWFNGLLGIGSGGQLNLSKAMNRAALNRIREAILALPGKAGKTHLSQFAKVVNARLADEKDPLHEDLKYRYLASALVITKDDPFTLGAEKKVQYFDELLSEIRLQTRVDGPNTVGRDQDFGIIVSVIHTEAMGRVAQFGQYLSNDPGVVLGKPRKKSPLARKMREAQGPRDELELGLTETLSPFFDIKSVVFATPEVKPRPTAQTGWEETVLAYLLVRAKDASVDKIPPVEMELKFVDLSGPVTIPAESAETVIKVDAGASVPARPVSKIEITQTLDTRQFQINGALALEIKAIANGLVPELEQLVDLEALKKDVGVRHINAQDGLQVKELNTWGDQVGPQTERLWTLSLNGDPIRSADGPTEFKFPQPKSKDTTVVYQTYDDMNLATLPEPVTALSPASGKGGTVATPKSSLTGWLIGGGLLLLAIVAGVIVAATRRGNGSAGDRPLRARDVFKMPGEVDGFSVVALLRRLKTSPLVKLRDSDKQELQKDLQKVQQSCFGSGASTLSDADLRGVAKKWLDAAC